VSARDRSEQAARAGSVEAASRAGEGEMFERFTDRARRAVVLSQEEARRLDHNYIGTEHLLLGLLREGEGPGDGGHGVAARALASAGIDLEAARRAVVEHSGRGGKGPVGGHIPFTPHAKHALELALREALGLGHDYIGTEHMLLGLVAEGEGLGAKVLVELGASLPKIRATVRGLARAEPGGDDRPPPVEARLPTLPLSAELGTALAEACDTAAASGAEEVTLTHVLRAAVDRPDSAAGRMLRNLGVDLDEAGKRLRDEPGEAGESPSS
jgi:ATP-dependent Clp protease ATP-binding subunit ClpA